MSVHRCTLSKVGVHRCTQGANRANHVGVHRCTQEAS